MESVDTSISVTLRTPPLSPTLLWIMVSKRVGRGLHFSMLDVPYTLPVNLGIIKKRDDMPITASICDCMMGENTKNQFYA